MRKLLNTLYITNEDYYLGCQGENIIIKLDGKIIRRFPIHILEDIVTFNYVGVSPALIKLCNEHKISLTFLTPSGNFCGKFIGKTNGNVLLRREQYRIADDERALQCAKWIIEAKLINSRKNYLRLINDYKDRLGNLEEIQIACDKIKESILTIPTVTTSDELRGIEGDGARTYFQLFDSLILHQKEDFKFVFRSRRPPLNRVNAALSFLYSLLTHEVQSALETVGLDSYVGFFHTDRPGRAGLALDMMEELRAYLVDRLVVSLINRKQIKADDFEVKENSAVLLNDDGRTKVINAWQKRKQQEIKHPYLKEKISIGLIPYVQAQLLARYIRGDIDYYPAFIS
ncbi:MULTISPECIES: type I-C CRISPR-associated endonuclease Cas1c [Aerococcus]|uniref:type I-C CRISPR-associated endonuclease Cas1c n=1 Tax=Aerococcus TaxID=1375 RepID=UPI0018A7911A|nr:MULTISPECIES: type I-C CRISPR-associated endonuclease Cas1c [Aerococcus]MCY3036054.1 type I-C CRISPR-associated endonuclease Cas1c [Aerococcus sp. Group 2]MCY3039149.1 type I-C CRISPR-associated endonuclease Cas1c [Aerococcus sp. Group 2]MCY3040725.1 type I-C CRISPR-associated endonuclease Cas1c [Aerococcus sp. Group 2]MCY3042717.1 type I-C CRISPR-associated endonuclease Cas1c [Aerococcus sp. Group 2]MDK6520862.1 type I-C CRISPR-associated endonuclease Cas1c [Aerococcus urinae]